MREGRGGGGEGRGLSCEMQVLIRHRQQLY